MDALVEHIKAAGLTRGQFARRVGISAPYLSQIISRARKPSLGVAIRIARATDNKVPVDAWLNDAVSPSQGGSEVLACRQKLASGENDNKIDAVEKIPHEGDA